MKLGSILNKITQLGYLSYSTTFLPYIKDREADLQTVDTIPLLRYLKRLQFTTQSHLVRAKSLYIKIYYIGMYFKNC